MPFEIEKLIQELCRLQEIETRLKEAQDEARKALEEEEKDLPGGISAGHQDFGQRFQIVQHEDKIKFIEKMLGIL